MTLIMEMNWQISIDKHINNRKYLALSKDTIDTIEQHYWTTLLLNDTIEQHFF
jgi:hypothetical protein